MNRWIALLGVTAVTVYLSWKVLEPFVEVLILGIALTVIFQPVHRRFVKMTGGHRLAAVLSTLFTFLVLMVPFTFVSITMVNELPGAAKTLQGGIESIHKAWDATAESGSWLAFGLMTMGLFVASVPLCWWFARCILIARVEGRGVMALALDAAGMQVGMLLGFLPALAMASMDPRLVWLHHGLMLLGMLLGMMAAAALQQGSRFRQWPFNLPHLNLNSKHVLQSKV